MKRQTQVPGVRRWYGDDFLELQAEALNAIDAVVGAYNKPCVISGCEYANGQLAKGFVALSVQNEGLKIMPFDGVAIALPCFLTAVKTPVNSVYADGVSRLSAYQYKAVATTTIPAAGVSYIKIEANGKCDRLPDVMQDAAHRMVSDAEKTVWNAKETPAGAQDKATKAQRDAEVNAIMFADTAREDAKKYTDTRETAVRGFIGQVETGLHNITESLTTTKADKTEVALKANSSTTMVELPSTGANIPESYLRRIGTWRANTANSDVRGRWLSLGDSTEQFQLRFSYPNSQTMKIEAQGCGANFCLSSITLLHTGNTTQTAIAGKVNGTSYESYTGGECTITLTGSLYTVMHRLDAYRYMVNITPINSSARSFSVIKKEYNYFEVQFSSATPFEIQILKY